MAYFWQNNLDVIAFLNGSLITIIAFLSLMMSRFLRTQRWWVWLGVASLCLGCASWFDISLLSSSNIIVPPWISLGLKFAGCIALSAFANAVWVDSGGSDRYINYAILAVAGITVYSMNAGVSVATAALMLCMFVPTCLLISFSMWRYIKQKKSPCVTATWIYVVGTLLLAVTNLVAPLRTLSPFMPIAERIQISAIGVAGSLHIIAMLVVIFGISLHIHTMCSIKMPVASCKNLSAIVGVTLLIVFSISIYAYQSGIRNIQRAHDSVLQTTLKLTSQLETTQNQQQRTSSSVRFDMMRDALINTPALMKLRLVHGAAEHGDYDEIIAPESNTLDLGWNDKFKKVTSLPHLDYPKMAVLTAESPHLFITRKAYVMRIPSLVGGIILTSLWLLLSAITVSSKQLADELQISAASIGMKQSRINRMFNSSQIGMAVLSLEGDIHEVNEAICMFLNRSSSELVGMNLNLLVMRDDFPELQHEMAILTNGDKDHYSAEIRFARPDGKQVWAWLNLMLEPGEAGDRAHIIMQLQDITFRKQDEDQLRHSWEMLQVLLNAPDYGVYLLNPDGSVLLCNANAALRCGLSVDKMAGVRPLDELSLEHRDFRNNQLDRVVKLAVPVRFEDACEEHTTSVAMWPVCDENGNVSTVALFLQDTSEVLRNKRELARITQQAAELKSIVDRSNVIVMRASAKGTKVTVNFVGGNLSMLGYPTEFYLGSEFNWSSIIANSDDFRVQDEFWDRYWAGDKDFFLETRLRDAHGKEQWYTITVNVLRDNLENTGFELVFSNVNSLRVAEYETRAMEQRIIQAQKYESLAVLAGGIAHDLNNNLMTIIGNAELLIGGIATDTDVSLQDTLHAAQRAAKLSEQMLAFSGRGIFQLSPCDLNKLVTDTIENLHTQVPSNVNLHVDLIDNPTQIQADHAQIAQVITNLCMNAIEAMPSGQGNLHVRTEERILSGNEQFGAHTGTIIAGKYAALIVQDDGHGMSDNMLERMFEPFYSTKLPGRGLGLAAALGIVRAHGGFVQLESQLGKGTTVTVYIPTRRSTEPDITPSKQHTGKKSNLILLVDDENAVLEVGRQMLIHLGYDVVTARNGSEALVAFAELEGKVDCVMLDLTMPIMDGGQTLRALRMVNQTVPVVFVSGYDYSSVFEKINGLNYQGFLQKPYRINQIRQLLENL